MTTDSIPSEPRRRLWRSRWAAIGAAVAVTFGGGGLFVANAASSPVSSVVTIDPVRILDTRDPVNIGLPGPFVSAISQKLRVTGGAVPAGATGVLLNVTVVGPTANGFLAVRPGDATGAPTTSSLNFTAGQAVPNSVQVGLPTTGANAGQIDVTYDAYGVAGPTTEVLIDVVGYMIQGGTGSAPTDPAVLARLDALEADNVALKNRVSTLETKLASVSTGTVGGQPTVTFSGVNVRIVDGTGNTECSATGFENCNGRGNLVIGYNEDTGSGGAEVRSGSHSLVLGVDNDWTSYASIIAGYNNTSSGQYSSVSGGFSNTASGTRSSVSGGSFNTASGQDSSVSGGFVNTASGTRSSVSGGAFKSCSGQNTLC